MSAHDCPFCHVRNNFTRVWSEGSRREHRGVVGNQVTLQCNNDKCLSIVSGFVDMSDTVIDYWPTQVGGKDFPDVPQHIAGAANEAHECLSINAYRGAVALARAVVEATAKDHEITKGNLMEKIDALAKQGVISDAMKDGAHEIRFAGNEVAHGDLAEEPMGPEDAEEVVSLMDAILLRVYQEPAQVARVRGRREARRSG